MKTFLDKWLAGEPVDGHDEEDIGDMISNDPEKQLESNQPKRQNFENLYWSRVISMQTYDYGENSRWPMKPDIDEERDRLA